jgi:hypothetical protein
MDNTGLVPGLGQIVTEIEGTAIINPTFPAFQHWHTDFYEIFDGESIGTGAVGTSCRFFHRVHESDPPLGHLGTRHQCEIQSRVHFRNSVQLFEFTNHVFSLLHCSPECTAVPFATCRIIVIFLFHCWLFYVFGT